MAQVKVRPRRATRGSVVPQTMRAAAIDRFGGPEVLTVHELTVPALEPNEVLIAVDTAGVGTWDADIRDGWAPGRLKAKFPLVIGCDGSGTIAAVGSRVRRFAVGDRVIAFDFLAEWRKGGFYAELVAVPADHVAPKPARLDMRQAGALPATGLTALQGVEDHLRVKRGEAVLVHGASGGVGSLAVQFARARGARVLGTARGADGVRLVRSLGVDAVDGEREDLTDAALRFAPDGLDAVLAYVGGPSLERCLDALARGGRVVYPNGVEPAPRRRRGIELTAYDAEEGARQLARLNRAVERARLKVPIAGEYRLRDARRAHEHVERHVVGRVVLLVR